MFNLRRLKPETLKCYLGQLQPRLQEIVPRRMELPPDFSDEWKKIGSKRSKFENLGIPIPKIYNHKKVPVILVSEVQ